MISYEPLYKTLKEKDITLAKLSSMIGCETNSVGVSIRNGNLSTVVLSKVCQVLKCSISDVIEWTDNSDNTSKELSFRIRIDWNHLNESVRKSGYTLKSIAEKLGLNNTTLNNAKRLDETISKRNLIAICQIINEDPAAFEVKE